MTVYVIIESWNDHDVIIYMLEGENRMKTLSVIVPSYNSESYMMQCIDSLINIDKGIEIIIVNDGSVDQTKLIANQYATKYPDQIKAIHQENKGHGGAVNTGIAHASGQYIKVVDSDDWVNRESLMKIVKKLKALIEADEAVDMMISNFVYDKVGVKQKKVMHYKGVLPQDRVFTWKNIGKFKPGNYILMHSVIYNIEILKACQLELPNHTFYVDNLFVYLPLPYVKTMYYMDECLYHYYIGRDDQSVNERVMMKRINQQLFVNELMIEKVDLKSIKERKKSNYMAHYLNIVTTVSSILLIKIGDKEAISKKENLWREIKKYDLVLYFKLRTSLLGSIIHFPGQIGKKITLFAYEKAQQRFGFN